MSALNRFISPRFRAIDGDGNPLVGAKLYFYEVGTTTLKTIYTTSALSTTAANPATSDSAGLFPAIFMGRDNYKVVLEDADGNEIFSEDPVRFPYTTGVLDETTNDYAIKLTDTRISNRIGLDVVFEVDTVLSAALAEHANEYSPICILANTVTDAAKPAIEFWHKNASDVFRISAISGDNGVLNFYTSDPFGSADRTKQIVIDRQGILRPAADGTQDLGRSSDRFKDIYATNGTINTCDELLKDKIQPAPIEWDLLEAAAPIHHIHKNTNDTENPRRHFSWPARKIIKAIEEKHGSTQNYAMVTLTPTPDDEYPDRAGIRDNEMAAWIHAHLLDLKNTVDQQAATITAQATAIAALEARILTLENSGLL